MSYSLNAVFLVRVKPCPTVLNIYFERARRTVRREEVFGVFVGEQRLDDLSLRLSLFVAMYGHMFSRLSMRSTAIICSYFNEKHLWTTTVFETGQLT